MELRIYLHDMVLFQTSTNNIVLFLIYRAGVVGNNVMLPVNIVIIIIIVGVYVAAIIRLGNKDEPLVWIHVISFQKS